MIILLDMDGVIANFHRKICTVFRIDEEEFLKEWDIEEYEMCSAIRKVLNKTKYVDISNNYIWNEINEYEKKYGFWENLDLYNWSINLVHCLENISDLYFCSKPTLDPRSLSGKYIWISKHFPDYKRKFIFTPNKDLLAKENIILIDDTKKNVLSFIKNGGNAILFPTKWNDIDKKQTSNPVVCVMNKISEILERKLNHKISEEQ